VEGHDLSHWKPSNFYSAAEIDAYVEDLVEGRRAYTSKMADEGLDPAIVRLAEKSFEKMMPTAKAAAIPREITEPPGVPAQPQPDEQRTGALPTASSGRSSWISSWEPRRPPRRLGRWK
jgi:hypothetical protein